MENVQGRNTKRKHLSKNKKKSWRKVNVDEVENFLEDERLQERTGGKVSEKKDDALFMLDKTKSKISKKVSQTSAERKRKAKEMLKDVEIGLKPPPPAKKDKRPKAMIERLASKGLPLKFKVAEQQRQSSRINNMKKARERPQKARADYDLWAVDNKLDIEVVNEDPHFLDVTRKRRVNVPAHLQNKPSLIPAVEAPHPGASYNPAYDEYTNLLHVANATEERKLRLEERIQRALYDQFPSLDDAPTEASKLKEMSAGLFDEDEESDSDTEKDLDKLSVNPPVCRENKKDERQRKKQKLIKDEGKRLKEEKIQRIRDNEIFRLKSIKREIKEKEIKINVKKRQRQAVKLMEPYTTKRLGKVKYEEPDLEIKLSKELVGSLREVKPEGDLLKDRMKSLQKRNIIEPRVNQKRRKNRNIKYVEKRKHREIQT